MAVEGGLGHFTGRPVVVELEMPTNPVKTGLLCAPGVVMKSQDFDNAVVQTRGRLAGKEAEWNATLWECHSHGDQFHWNLAGEIIVISRRGVVKRDRAASNPLYTKRSFWRIK